MFSHAKTSFTYTRIDGSVADFIPNAVWDLRTLMNLVLYVDSNNIWVLESSHGIKEITEQAAQHILDQVVKSNF